MAGVGLQSAGTSSAGYGSISPINPNSGRVLRDPLVVGSSGSRRIDPFTRDYVVDTDGRLSGMPNVPQLVQLAITTEFNTSAPRGMGHKLKSIDRVTANFEQVVLSVLTNALKRLVDLRLVEVVGFSSFKSGKKDGLQPGQTYGRLQWRDLTTNTVHEEIV